MIFQDHRRVPVTVSNVKIPLQSLRRGLLEGFLELVCNFIEYFIKHLNSKLFKNVAKIQRGWWALVAHAMLIT
jgi:hypothetical protein